MKDILNQIMKDKYEGYNALLDDMEDDFTIDKYDEFFNLLEKVDFPAAINPWIIYSVAFLLIKSPLMCSFYN